jgi:hypothetical protein
LISCSQSSPAGGASRRRHVTPDSFVPYGFPLAGGRRFVRASRARIDRDEAVASHARRLLSSSPSCAVRIFAPVVVFGSRNRRLRANRELVAMLDEQPLLLRALMRVRTSTHERAGFSRAA